MLNPEAPDDADNPIQKATCGPLFPEIDAFKKRFGLELGTGYGMTEIGAVTATEGTTIEDWRSCGKVRPGRPGYRLKVVDEHDEEVGPGVVGELIVRCDEPWCMNVGYYGMPEKTAEAWRNGWFHTGDGFNVRRERQLLLRRPPEGRHPAPRREHLVVRGRGVRQRPPGRDRERGDRSAVGARRGRSEGVRRAQAGVAS